MILVTVGTHPAPFDRLVRAAEAHAAASGERVVVQCGPSRVPTPHCESHQWLAPDRLEALAAEARVVVTHAGPASIFLAWDHGRPVVVVPRERAHGEHVDDHQVHFAAFLGDRIVQIREVTRLSEALQSVASNGDSGRTRMQQQASKDFAQKLEALVQGLVVGRRRGDGAP